MDKNVCVNLFVAVMMGTYVLQQCITITGLEPLHISIQHDFLQTNHSTNMLTGESTNKKNERINTEILKESRR
jgi:hypothetical protein